MVNNHEMLCGYIGGKHSESVGNNFVLHRTIVARWLNRAAWGRRVDNQTVSELGKHQVAHNPQHLQQSSPF